MEDRNLFKIQRTNTPHHLSNLSDENIKSNLLLTKDCVIVFDEQGRVILFNETATKIFPCFTQKIIGQHMSKLIASKTRPHKRLFSKSIKYFSLAALGIPQHFEWIVGRDKKPVEAYNVLFNAATLDGTKVIIARVIDILETKTLEWVLLSLAEINNRGSILEVIEDITQLAAQVFKTEYALVNLFDNNDKVYTVSHIYKGKKQQKFVYDLANTPCEVVKNKKKICQFNGNVPVKFPKSQFTLDWKIKSYLGGPLINSQKTVVGLLILMSEHNIEVNSLYKNLFRLFMDRISLEVERLISDKKLQFLASFPEQDPNPILSIRTDGEVIYSNKTGTTIINHWSKTEGKIPETFKAACMEVQNSKLFKREELEVDGRVYLFTFSWIEAFSQINIYGTDISELKSVQKKMRDLANYDRLTAVPNRQFFETTLTSYIDYAYKNSKQLALLLIDLDNFKAVNDTLGHHVGDHLLKTLSKRISGCLRRKDFIARLGGDEFVVLLKMKNCDEIELVADKINKALATPFELGDYQVETSCSIGISFYPQNGTTNSDLLKHADIAMYQAKKNGSNQYALFSNSKLLTQSKRRTVIKKDLKQPCLARQLYLDYQPQFDLSSAKIVGFEAFLRWRHPTQGLISPAEFIPLAEQTGSINSIGNWAINQALEDFKSTMCSINNAKLSLNITMTQLNDQHFIANLCENIDRMDLTNSLVVLDISDQKSVLHYRHLDEHLQALHNQGIQLSLDNYGSEQSSLSRLLNAPVNIVKIDHNFLHALEKEPRNKAFISGIIDLATKLELQVIQKGVENESQNEVLKTLGCKFAQGYYYCPPLSISRLQSYLLKYSRFN
ncbi:MAG: EAL domain-containing protein [Tatlockia sp.]|nr:EAL domain-containing protein [Tatlockia sp.]